jgi:hypothetical protein
VRKSGRISIIVYTVIVNLDAIPARGGRMTEPNDKGSKEWIKWAYQEIYIRGKDSEYVKRKILPYLKDIGV